MGLVLANGQVSHEFGGNCRLAISVTPTPDGVAQAAFSRFRRALDYKQSVIYNVHEFSLLSNAPTT